MRTSLKVGNFEVIADISLNLHWVDVCSLTSTYLQPTCLPFKSLKGFTGHQPDERGRETAGEC